MEHLPKISIVIPSYNQGNYIGQTLQSIIDQQYPHTEIIIIDAGSTDDTLDVIKKYDNHLSYWVSEPDNGQAHAINKGLAKVTGDVFNWINSDDYLEPGALQAISHYVTSNPDDEVICGYTRCFYDETDETSHEYRMGVKHTVADTIVEVEMNQPGTFFKSAVVKELGGVNESLRYVFDDELWFRYLCKSGTGKIGFTDQRIAQFRLHGASKSVGEGFDHFNKEIQSLYIDIAENAAAPAWMLQYMQQAPHSDKYVSKGKWDISQLNADRFLAAFAAKYINGLYLAGKIPEANQAMELILKGDHFKWNRMLLSLRIKLALS